MDDNVDRKKIIIRIVITMAICITLGSWYSTQSVAALCNYHEDLGFNINGIYFPFMFFYWNSNIQIATQIPDILQHCKFPIMLGFIVGGFFSVMIGKSGKTMTSHGTARFAKPEDVSKAGLDAKKNGVVVGRNPFTNEIMLHDGPEHIFLAAPTRSGKGVGIIMPTAITWHNSAFFFDPKQELWIHTSGYRKRVMGQKVMKFEPLCSDGSGARWNPYTEVDFRGLKEMDDVRTINETIVKTGESGGSKDPFWENSAIGLLNGTTLHLLYKHYQEGKPLPCPSDTASFLASPTMDKPHLFTSMKIYPHISPEEFMELEYPVPGGNFDTFLNSEQIMPTDKGKTPEEKQQYILLEERYRIWQQCKYQTNSYIVYKKGKKHPITGETLEGDLIKFRNCLKEIYGEYAPDLKPFKNHIKDSLAKFKKDPIETTNEELNAITTLEDLRKYIVKAKEHGILLYWGAPDVTDCEDLKKINDTITKNEKLFPLYQLLVHPKVAEEAQKILGNAEQTGASIISSAQTPLNLYQDPLIKKNTCVSDFSFRDLLNPAQAVSLYLVIQPNDVPKVRPLTRLFVNTMLAKTVRDMKFDTPANKKQRLLMLLDEFPQLNKLETIENTLAICAGYGVKICLVVQSITQLNQIYTKDNSILDNSQVQIYMTPSNLAAAKELSEIMGDQTIKSDSKSSDGNSLFTKSTSTSEQGRKLMNPDELLRMSKDKELVICQGCRPIICPKIRWFQEPFFKERILAIKAPPFSDTCTRMENYSELFAVNAPDVADMIQRQEEVAKAKAEKAAKYAKKRKSENKGKTDLIKDENEQSKSINLNNNMKEENENGKQNESTSHSNTVEQQNEKIIRSQADNEESQGNQTVIKKSRCSNSKSVEQNQIQQSDSVQSEQENSKISNNQSKSNGVLNNKPKLSPKEILALVKQHRANVSYKSKKFAEVDLYADKKPEADEDDSD